MSGSTGVKPGTLGPGGPCSNPSSTSLLPGAVRQFSLPQFLHPHNVMIRPGPLSSLWAIIRVDAYKVLGAGSKAWSGLPSTVVDGLSSELTKSKRGG